MESYSFFFCFGRVIFCLFTFMAWRHCKLNLHPVDSVWLRRKWKNREKKMENALISGGWNN